MDAAVASASSNLVFLLRLDQGSLGLERSGLGRDSLSGSSNDLAIPQEALDQPVAVTVADLAGIDAGRAQVEVPVITGAAVVVLVRDDVLAVVAVDGEGRGGRWGRGSSLVANGVLALVGHASELCKPLVSCRGSPGDSNGNLSARGGDNGRGSLVDGLAGGAGSGAHDGARAAGAGVGKRRVDEQLLELALELGDGHGLGPLRGVVDNRGLRGHDEGRAGRRGRAVRDGVLFGRAGDVVLDGGGLGDDGLLVSDGDLQTQLQLGLGGAVELFIDGGIRRVEGDEGSGAVGVALKDGVGGGRDLEQGPQLLCREGHVSRGDLLLLLLLFSFCFFMLFLSSLLVSVSARANGTNGADERQQRRAPGRRRWEGKEEAEAEDVQRGYALSYLARQRAGPEIAKGQLEPLVGAVGVDLEGDESVWAGGRRRSHNGRAGRAQSMMVSLIDYCGCWGSGGRSETVVEGRAGRASGDVRQKLRSTGGLSRGSGSQ